MASTYKVARADTRSPEVVYCILAMHKGVFGATAPLICPWDPKVHAWFAHDDIGSVPVAFATLIESDDEGYLNRCVVTPAHRGRGLQKRLIRARERFARKAGLARLVSDCTDNPTSAASLAACGFETFTPVEPWAFKRSPLLAKGTPMMPAIWAACFAWFWNQFEEKFCMAAVRHLLIDADVLVYKAACSCERAFEWDEGQWTYQADENEAREAVDREVEHITEKLKATASPSRSPIRSTSARPSCQPTRPTGRPQGSLSSSRRCASGCSTSATPR